MGETASQAATSFSNLPVMRQIALLLGLSASIAIGVWVVIWSREPIYRPLFSHLNSTEASEVVDVLQRNGFDFKLNKDTGTIMVDSDDVHDARIKLAAEGLPRGSGRGYEIFSNGSSFTTSQFMETARYRHALETELSRTIAKFNHVKNARVHLAIPRQSAFIRHGRKPSASVFLTIYNGYSLRKHSIASITNLVASSVPSLSSDNVTVVDQNGQLLNEGGGHNLMSMTDKFFDYRQELEQAYSDKIKEILEPILGVGRVRAKVSADIDFTMSEQTRESYNPDLPALRSEQEMREKRSSNSGPGGVAGATQNQPPGEGDLQTTQTVTAGAAQGSDKDSKVQFYKNYELDKTISHTKQQPGRIQRLTVAVLIDNKYSVDKDSGEVSNAPVSAEELGKIRLLVADAIGINIKRGDSINVINVAFNKPAPLEELPPIPFYKQGWFWEIAKQALGGLFILILVFGVIRPILKNMSNQGKKLADAQMEGAEAKAKLEAPEDTPDTRMASAQQYAGDNPKGVANVVKTWVDGG